MQEPPQSDLSLVQLPLQFNFVGKGSDIYQTIYRDTNEHFVYMGRMVPPLNPFERRDYYTDIYVFFVCIATSRLICIAPLANEVELQAELDDPRSD